MKKGDFTKYVDEIKSRVEAGEITKEDAIYFVFAKVSKIFEDMDNRVSKEQFMKDRMAEAVNYN